MVRRMGSKAVTLKSTESLLTGFKLSEDEKFWRKQKKIMLAALGNAPETLIAQGVTQSGVSTSFALVNKTVLQTAESYIDPWWESIEQTSRDALRSAITENIESGQPLKELISALEPVFGPERADLIATTEVTNLFTQGNDIAFQAAGVIEVDFQTVNDGLVDELCQDAESGSPYTRQYAPQPPLHPRCRCRLVPRVSDMTPEKVAKEIRSVAIEREPEIKGTVKTIARQTGMETVGLKFDVKSESSIVSKLTRKGTDPENVLDSLRFTATAPAEDYTESTQNFLRELDNRGFTIDMANTDNHWENPSYHGLNTIIESPDGFRFELQFHTPESFEIKEANHKLYEQARVLPDGPEKKALNDQMQSAWDNMEMPPNAKTLLR